MSAHDSSGGGGGGSSSGVRRALLVEFDSASKGGSGSTPEVATTAGRRSGHVGLALEHDAHGTDGGSKQAAALVLRKYHKAKQLLAAQGEEIRLLRARPTGTAGAAAGSPARVPAPTAPPAALQPGSGEEEAAAMAAAAAAAGVTPSPGRYSELLHALRADNASLSAALAAERRTAQALEQRADQDRVAVAAQQARAAAALATAAAAEEKLRSEQAARAAAEAEAGRQREGAAQLEARLEAQERGLRDTGARLQEVGSGGTRAWATLRAPL